MPIEVADSPSLVGELARIMHYNIWLKDSNGQCWLGSWKGNPGGGYNSAAEQTLGERLKTEGRDGFQVGYLKALFSGS